VCKDPGIRSGGALEILGVVASLALTAKAPVLSALDGYLLFRVLRRLNCASALCFQQEHKKCV
jgi:hypothetical protein